MHNNSDFLAAALQMARCSEQNSDPVIIAQYKCEADALIAAYYKRRTEAQGGLPYNLLTTFFPPEGDALAGVGEGE